MKTNPLHFLFLFLASLLLLPACGDEDFSTNPEHTLAFSQDTLQMDTVLTGIGTSTRTVIVYNRHKQPLLISSITLANAGNSGVRINVDGMKGTHFTDVEIREQDSIYIFIEATITPQDSDEPVLKKDSIIFMTNGIRQDVRIRVYGQDGIALRAKEITQDTVFNSRRPIVIYDSLSVKADARLTLAAGTRLYFHGKADLQVHGQLRAEGTLEAPVVFRGDRTDKLFANLPYDRLPGQWGGIRLRTSSYDNSLTHVNIHGGTYGIRCDSAATDQNKLTLTHSIIHQVSGDALSLTSCQAIIGNCLLSNAGGNVVSILGGNYEFVHCTLANYYSWAIRKGVSLFIKNEQNKIYYPITMAAFRNCIIAGSSGDEINGGRGDDASIPYNYYFSYSLINSIEDQNDKITNVVWKKDNFFSLINTDDQLYNFELNKKSAAIDIGKAEDALNYPLDLKGVSRQTDKAPDAGCYEYIPTDDEPADDVQ